MNHAVTGSDTSFIECCRAPYILFFCAPSCIRPCQLSGGGRYIRLGGALKARIIKFMTSKRTFVHSTIPFVCRGRSKNSLTHYNLSVQLAFGIQLTINRDSLRFTLSSTLMEGGGGGVPSRANCGSFRCPNYVIRFKKTSSMNIIS